MQSFFAELDLLFEFLGFACESRLVFGVDDLICPLLIGYQLIIFSVLGEDRRNEWTHLAQSPELIRA
jgi:hypothetical protein